VQRVILRTVHVDELGHRRNDCALLVRRERERDRDQRRSNEIPDAVARADRTQQRNDDRDPAQHVAPQRQIADRVRGERREARGIERCDDAKRERRGHEREPRERAEPNAQRRQLDRREKGNPAAGCLPSVVQIPGFFALYKVLYTTIEMRHQPFFGWIKDLSAPDPLTVFNLFGLIPWDPTVVPVIGPFLHLGPWPLIMGLTMWAQMKLNPPPPDPAQKMIFDSMPIIFTFMLANFSAGLVIYWAWNNTLSVIQQSVIMRKHGAKVELIDNVKALFAKKEKA